MRVHREVHRQATPHVKAELASVSWTTFCGSRYRVVIRVFAGPIIRKYRPLSELSGTKPLFLVEKRQNFRLNARVTTA
jgi:hypothetical protein